jgi:hypothetical protein
VLRRLDIGGGMKKRWTDARGELTNHLRFAHQIVGHYHPARYRIGYPLYLGWAEARALRWVWDRARDSTPLAGRVLQSLHTVGLLPRVARDIRRELPSGRAGAHEQRRAHPRSDHD